MNIKKYTNPKAKVIGDYSLNDLKSIDIITIPDTLSPEELNALEYLPKNIEVIIKSNNITSIDEINYFNNIKKIINKVSSFRKKYTFIIEVNNRELLRQSNLLAAITRNVNLKITSNNYTYDLEEYLSEENKLEKLTKQIRESKLSPLEKFLAVYDTVKHFKPYKENVEKQNESRELHHILKDDNDYIVCVGFARLLSELLNRVGIPSKYIHVDVDDSYDKGKITDVKNINHIGHARNIIKLDDDKYNIHGLYLADSTFDSRKEKNGYLHSLMTFDRLKEAKRLEKLNDIDLLLDFHDLHEFEKKLTYYLKKEENKFTSGFTNHDDLLRRNYKYLYLKIIDILRDLDEKTFISFYTKYNDSLYNEIDHLSMHKLNEIIAHFTTDFYYYIIRLSNNEINMQDILTAAAVGKKELSKLSDEDFKKWLRSTVDDYIGNKDYEFPYKYNPASKEGYLEERKKRG